MIEVKKFSAKWCGPCKMLVPIMENVKNKFNDVSFKDIDVDVDFKESQKYNVRSVPTVVIEVNGIEVQRFAGLQSEMAYTNRLTELKQ